MNTNTYEQSIIDRTTDEGVYTDLECSRCEDGYIEHVLWGWGEGIDELCDRLGWLADNNGDIVCPDCHCK